MDAAPEKHAACNEGELEEWVNILVLSADFAEQNKKIIFEG